MNKKQCADVLKRIKRLYPAFSLPLEDETALADVLCDWHELLSDVAYDYAIKNLSEYAKGPENKYPPHPGVLAKPMKTEADRYHEDMRSAGIHNLEEWEMMRKRAVPPTPDQRERVKRYAKRV